MIDWLIDWWLIDLIDWLIDWPHNWPFRGVTFCLAVLANASSLLKTTSLHSTMTCSSTAKDWIFVAEIASPKPSSRTRPPLDAAMEASLCMYGVSQRSITGLPMITKCSSVSSYFAPASFHNGLQFSPRPKILISAILSAPTVASTRATVSFPGSFLTAVTQLWLSRRWRGVAWLCVTIQRTALAETYML